MIGNDVPLTLDLADKALQVEALHCAHMTLPYLIDGCVVCVVVEHDVEACCLPPCKTICKTTACKTIRKSTAEHDVDACCLPPSFKKGFRV
jgi:hypothetical protein